MTHKMYRDMDWLREQVKAGIEGYLEQNREELAEYIAEYVMRQVHDACCAEYSAYDTEEEGAFLIYDTVEDPGEFDRLYGGENRG